ncbi:hypothetical protein ACKGJN_16345, partial [Gillisia sp. Q332]|uniref:hypothetical protein n=1 Tax=Gillisia xinjiangensis TaxID=3384765 RepID=UPI00391C36F8
VEISGSASLCSPGQYSIQTGVNVQWSANPTNLVNISNNGSSNVTVTPVSSSSKGSVTLSAIISSPSCGSKTLTKDVWVGNPNEVTKLSHVSFGCTMGEIFVKTALGAEQYEWQVYGAQIVAPGTGTTYIGEEGSIFVDPDDGNYEFTVKVRAINACGYSNWYTKTIPMDCSGGPTPLSTSPEEDNDASETIVAYPNPAKDQITVIVKGNYEFTGTLPTGIHAIRVLDQNSIERQYYT